MRRAIAGMHRRARGVAVLIVVLVVVAWVDPLGAGAQSQEPKPGATVVAPPTAEPASATPATDEASATPGASGINGASYVSPTFGYSLSWDEAVWQVEDELLLDEYDGLQLGTEVSIFYLEGYTGFEGDPEQCLSDAVNELATRGSIAGLEAVSRPLPVPADRVAFVALYQYTLTLEDGGTLDVVEYVECQTLVVGEAVLEITFQTPASEYNRELPHYRRLLAALAIPEAN